mgnify:CR=1 FL=1
MRPNLRLEPTAPSLVALAPALRLSRRSLARLKLCESTVGIDALLERKESYES